MKKYYKIFNDSNTNLDDFNDSPLSKEKVSIIKNRLSKKINKRSSVSKKLIAVATVFIVVLSPIFTNERVLAHINNSIVNSINKIIGKYEDDKSTILYENKTSHKIIVYSSHNSETYENGMSVVDVGEKINKILNNMQLDSIHLNSKNPGYEDSYDYSNALIQNNIENFNESFLIDIHRLDGSTEAKKRSPDIEFILVESNPYYEECKDLSEKLVENIQKNSDLNVRIYSYKTGYLNFNQDLSPKALTVNIGDNYHSEESINEIIDVFSKALRDVIN
ncbi:hypothetical protein GNF80_10940 [Clostridium perfringens]|nr:hypothetical protein [Clostridium perfringens]